MQLFSLTNKLWVAAFAVFLVVASANNNASPPKSVQAGAESLDEYLKLLENRRTGLAIHHASTAQGKPLLDVLLSNRVKIARIFVPEHGFKGNQEAGESVKNSVSTAGIPVISLYNNVKKPTAKHLADIDVMIFDMQDVGVRCYTYLSTMHYVMEACAENGVPLIVLDRPNPNGHYIDGPVLEPRLRSFIGMHQIPWVHGMTLGELAMMINGEGWLNGGLRCQLRVIPCKSYVHGSQYVLPIAPSPNLPNMMSVYLYPSLCFFEGTVVSVGRGTSVPFQAAGHPLWNNKNYVFTPRRSDANKNPLYKDKSCKGIDLSKLNIDAIYNIQQINLEWLIEAYKYFGGSFFNENFDYLAGNRVLRKQIESGISADSIRRTWQKDIIKFRQTRTKYLLYTDTFR